MQEESILLQASLLLETHGCTDYEPESPTLCSSGLGDCLQRVMLTLLSRSLPCLLTHSLPGLTNSCALISLANFSVDAAPSASAADKVVVIPMPQLSPHMTSGSVRKWLKQPGDEIATYDVIMEIDTDSLSEEAYKVGDFAGTVTMLVEVCALVLKAAPATYQLLCH